MERIKQLRRWVCWNATPVKGRMTKVPCAANGGATGTDEKYAHTWVTYAVFLMSDDAVSELSKYRTLGMVNVWQGNMQNGEPTKLLGVPVITCSAMTTVERGRMPILYGDFSHFLIGDRAHRSIKRLNEVYTHQGQVGYVVSQRVDAVLLDKGAIAGLKVQ